MPFPESFATGRLVAERLRPEHEVDIHRMHQDAEQMAMLGGIRGEAQTSAYMMRNLQHWTDFGFGLWLLRDAGNGRVAGRALLRHVLIEGTDEIEVGYSFFPEFWGRGLATEIAGACLTHGRHALGFTSMVALTVPHNTGSRRVMEKVGMRFERDVVFFGIPHVLYRTSSEVPA